MWQGSLEPKSLQKDQVESCFEFSDWLLFHCLIVYLSCPPVLHNIFHTPVAQYLVCAVNAVKHQPTNHLQV